MSSEKEIRASKTVPSALPQESHFQRTLLPIDIITLHVNDQNSADMKHIGEGRNNKHYAIKSVTDGNGKVPAAELFCYELAYRVTIPTPAYSLVSINDGELAFGSEWEGGVVKDSVNLSYNSFVLAVLGGRIQVKNIRAFLSKVYAFDLFVNNVDRHWQNILWRDSYNGNIIALAYDFGRASFAIDPIGLDAFDAKHNTQSAFFTLLNLTQNYNRADAVECLNAIRAITVEDIKQIFETMPHAWLSKDERKAYIDWWSSSARIERLDHILSRV